MPVLGPGQSHGKNSRAKARYHKLAKAYEASLCTVRCIQRLRYSRDDGGVKHSTSRLRGWHAYYRQTDGGQLVEITLQGDECSDYLNFVVKDASTGTWHDFYGDNFHVPLQLALTSQAFDESMDEDVALLDDQLPELSGELTGIWAYIKWEHDGCPNRSQQESDSEYRQGIQVVITISL